MDKKTKEEILNILDNVTYWETCPEDYKQRIEKIKLALTIPVVSYTFKEKCKTDIEGLEKEVI